MAVRSDLSEEAHRRPAARGEPISMPEPLEPPYRPWLRERLRGLPGWQCSKRGRVVRREWRFDSQAAASAFVIALISTTRDRALISFCSWSGPRVFVMLTSRASRVNEELLHLAETERLPRIAPDEPHPIRLPAYVFWASLDPHPPEEIRTFRVPA